MSKQYMYDVFISYAHEDSKVAEKIKNKLETHSATGRRISVFLDVKTIKSGENIVDKISEALSRSRFFLLLLSPASINAEWPLAERCAALLNDLSGRAGRIIPVIVGECEIPLLLRIRKWVDLRSDADFDKNISRIATQITGQSLSHSTERHSLNTHEDDGMAAVLSYPHSHEPDPIDEVLYTNLHEVKKLPKILTASTPYKTRQSIAHALQSKIPTCIISSGKLYTPLNIDDKNNSLRKAVDANDVSDVSREFWFEKNDNKVLLTQLLNLQANHFCARLGLSYDKTGKKYYGDIDTITTKKVKWMAGVRTGRRGLIVPNTINGKIRFYRHRALKLSYSVLGRQIFLQINPSWTFTTDGSTVINNVTRRAVLNIRLQSRMRNRAQFAEQRFWSWLLTKNGFIEIGDSDNSTTINTIPLKLTSRVGVYSDYQQISFDTSNPPALVGKSGENSAYGSTEAS